ncbi:hypothetical protein T492DRAFT_876678 [Pavlovales sp. CCMP2436]|nr:hypothetical protein T492DRAFT_876678 [Pavlovales sp. CCMP2436]
MRLFDLAPDNDATARRALGTYEYARPTGAASRVLWDHSFELISLLVASGTATICVEGAVEGKALRSCLHKSARLDARAAAPELPVRMTDPGASDLAHAAQPCVPGTLDMRTLKLRCLQARTNLLRAQVGLPLVPAEASELLAFAGRTAGIFVYTPSAGAAIFGRWGTLDMRALKLRCLQARTNLLRAQAGLPLVPAEASELLAFAGDRPPSTHTRALEMQALPAAQAVSHYRASLATRPQTHSVDTLENQAWYKEAPQTHDKTSAEY